VEIGFFIFRLIAQLYYFCNYNSSTVFALICVIWLKWKENVCIKFAFNFRKINHFLLFWRSHFQVSIEDYYHSRAKANNLLTNWVKDFIHFQFVYKSWGLNFPCKFNSWHLFLVWTQFLRWTFWGCQICVIGQTCFDLAFISRYKW